LKNLVVAYVCGVLFAVGLAVSGMTHPAKIIAFLDLGHWDPSLALVMGSGLAINALAFRFALRRPHPVWAKRFSLPAATPIDRSLVAGAALFGVGWGLGGYCPGPGLTSVPSGAPSAVAFVAAMLAAMVVYALLSRRRTSRGRRSSEGVTAPGDPQQAHEPFEPF
jgi:hypothetical protein